MFPYDNYVSFSPMDNWRGETEIIMMDTKKDSRNKKREVFLLFTFMVVNFKFIYSSHVFFVVVFLVFLLRSFEGVFLVFRLLLHVPFFLEKWRQKWDGYDDMMTVWWEGQFIRSNFVSDSFFPNDAEILIWKSARRYMISKSFAFKA